MVCITTLHFTWAKHLGILRPSHENIHVTGKSSSRGVAPKSQGRHHGHQEIAPVLRATGTPVVSETLAGHGGSRWFPPRSGKDS